MKKIITFSIAFIILSIFAFTIWLVDSSQFNPDSKNISLVEVPSRETEAVVLAHGPTVQAELQKALIDVPPRIDLNQSDVIVKVKWAIFDILKTNNDLWPLIESDEQAINGIRLVSIGGRYVAFTRQRIEWAGPLEILDLETMQIHSYDVGPEALIEDPEYIVYLDSSKIYLYKPDWSSPIIIEGSQLTEPETYDFCGGCMAGLLDPQFSHTDADFTISSFIWRSARPEKANEYTFKLP